MKVTTQYGLEIARECHDVEARKVIEQLLSDRATMRQMLTDEIRNTRTLVAGHGIQYDVLASIADLHEQVLGRMGE